MDFDPVAYLKQKYQQAKDYVAQDPELSTYADIAKTGLKGLGNAANTAANVFKYSTPAAYAFGEAGNPNPDSNILGQIGHVPTEGLMAATGPFGVIKGGGMKTPAVEQTLQAIPGELKPAQTFDGLLGETASRPLEKVPWEKAYTEFTDYMNRNAGPNWADKLPIDEIKTNYKSFLHSRPINPMERGFPQEFQQNSAQTKYPDAFIDFAEAKYGPDKWLDFNDEQMKRAKIEFQQQLPNRGLLPVAGGGELTPSGEQTLQSLTPQDVPPPKPQTLSERAGNAAAIDAFPNRFGLGEKDETAKLMLRKHKELIKKGYSEPYYGKPTGNPIWRDKTIDPEAEKMLHPLPARTDSHDLGGVLGKGVPSATGADPFAWIEQKYGTTAKTLERNYNNPLQIHTRSDYIASDTMLEHLNPAKHEINMHFSNTDMKLGHILEPGEPSFQRRLEAAQRLQAAGFKVNLVQDNLIGMPNKEIELGYGEPRKVPLRLGTDQLSQERLRKMAGGIPIKINNVKLTKEAIKLIKEKTGLTTPKE